MRRSREPGHADITDGLALSDAAAVSRGIMESRHVRIKSRDVAAVLHNDVVTVAVILAAKDDLAIAGRLDTS